MPTKPIGMERLVPEDMEAMEMDDLIDWAQNVINQANELIAEMQFTTAKLELWASLNGDDC